MRVALILLAVCLPLVAPADETEVEVLLKQLDSPSWKARDKASRRLVEIVPLESKTYHRLVGLVSKARDLETKQRLRGIVEGIAARWIDRGVKSYFKGMDNSGGSRQPLLVIDSAIALEVFRKTGPRAMVGKLADQKLDFSRRIVILVSHYEGSIATKVTFEKPVWKDGRVLLRIQRTDPRGAMEDESSNHSFLLSLPRFAGSVVLRVGDRQVGKATVTALPASDHSVLIGVLGHREAETRKWAMDKLTGLGAAVVPALIDALGSKVPGIANHAATTLGRIGKPADRIALALARTLAATHDGDDGGWAAAAALGKLGRRAESATPVLLKMLGKDSSKRIAAELLGKVARPTPTVVSALVHAGADQALKALDTPGPDCVDLLVEASAHKDAKVRGTATHLLGRIGKPVDTVVPALVARLGDKDPMRTDAAVALGRIRKKPELVIPALVRAFSRHGTERSDPSVRAALVRFGKAAVPATVEVLDRASTASLTLIDIGAPAVPALADAVKGHARDAVRHTAARLLGMINSRPDLTIPALLAALRQAPTQSNAAWSLGVKVGNVPANRAPVARGLAAALGSKSKETRLGALQALCWMKSVGPEPIDAMAKALDDPVLKVRYEAARALYSAGAPGAKAVPALIRGIQSGRLRWLIGWAALAQLCTAKQAETAVPVLLRGASHTDSRVRRVCVQRLVEYAATTKDPALKKKIEDAIKVR